MRRIKATVFGIIAIIVVLFIMAQAGNIGVPWIFSLAVIVIIILIVLSLIRTWI